MSNLNHIGTIFESNDRKEALIKMTFWSTAHTKLPHDFKRLEMYHVSHMDHFYYFYGAFLALTDVVTMKWRMEMAT